MGQKTTKDNLFHNFRQPSIYNSYVYNSLKHNSCEVIEMASRYTALAIKIDNFIGNMPRLSFNISKTRFQTLLISLHQHKGNTLVHSYTMFKKIQW